jgi:hypothetical protein
VLGGPAWEFPGWRGPTLALLYKLGLFNSISRYAEWGWAPGKEKF